MNNDVVFDDNDDISLIVRPKKAKKESLFIRLIISGGFAKTHDEAEKVLLVIAIIGLVISMFVLFSTFHQPAPPTPAQTAASFHESP